MANKILVTTDLSKNSTSGIRFAIQLASQDKSALIFYHLIDLQKPTRWNEETYKSYAQQEVANAKKKLNHFVADVYKKSAIRPGKYDCVVQIGSAAGENIIQHALTIKASFICMGTRGAGGIRRILGTHTSTVLTHSPVPVFAVPKNYRRGPIDHMLYSTDLEHLKTELKKVKKVADAIKAKVSVLHFDYLYDLKETQIKLAKIASQYKTSGVKFHFQKLNIENSLDVHLMKAIRRLKPSLVVLFTKQNRDWYERLFLSSKSAEVSFDTKKPLLVFPKKSA